MKKIYITTPIYYPNAELHIGHAYTTIIADFYKKIYELQEYDSKLLTGTDEHGQKIEEVAKKNNKSPIDYVEPIVDEIKKLWNELEIDYDFFSRTTTDFHFETVQNVYKIFLEKGYIYKDNYESPYCVSCENYLTKSQIIDGSRCIVCKKEFILLKEETHFFKMSLFKNKIKELLENTDLLIPSKRKNELINNFLNEELKDLSISRKSVKWGIPIPGDEEFVFYVWMDALLNYISALGYMNSQEDLMNYWENTIHIIGKEITRFHCIYWIAFIIALELPLPKTIFAHGWILHDNEKMSKSIGNVIGPRLLINRYGADVVKYFFLSEINPSEDGDFSITKFIQKINSDIVNDLANLVSRTHGMIIKSLNSKVLICDISGTTEIKSIEDINNLMQNSIKEINIFNYQKGIKDIWQIISLLNKYIENEAPWKVEDNSRLNEIFFFVINAINLIASLIEPILPNLAKLVLKNFSLERFYKISELEKFILIENDIEISEKENVYNRLDINTEVEWFKNELKK